VAQRLTRLTYQDRRDIGLILWPYKISASSSAFSRNHWI
jgi:hypothetical protein